MSRVGSVLLLVLAVTIAASTVALADEPYRTMLVQIDASEYPVVRAVASVIGPDGRVVRGLQSKDFVVREAGSVRSSEVRPASVGAPVAIALVLDTSGSMAGAPLAAAKDSIGSVLDALGQRDAAALVTFSGQATVAQALTTDMTALRSATQRAVAGGDTAIYDALVEATRLLGQVTPSRRAIVLLTDGVDTASRSSKEAALEAVRGAGYAVHVIALGSSLDGPTLQAIADASAGGTAHVAPSPAELTGIYAALTEEILTPYVLSFRSTAAGGPVELVVEVLREGIPAGRARGVFTAPSGAAPTALIPSTARDPEAAAAPVAAILDERGAGGVRLPHLVGALGGAAVLLIFTGSVLALGSDPRRERRRLRAYVSGPGRGHHSVARRALARRLAGALTEKLGGSARRFAPARVLDGTSVALARAGEPLGLGAAEFIGLRAALAVLLAVVSGILATAGGSDAAQVASVAVGGALLGWILPGSALRSAVKRRQKHVLRALPASLDMLALSAEAGMTFDGSVSQVVERWRTPLSDELRRMLALMRIGRPRREALSELARRTGVPEVARFSATITQADALGVPISRALLELASDMRIRRRQRAEEQARRAPILMLIPTVTLIFPALFVVILGPAVPSILAIFSTR